MPLVKFSRRIVWAATAAFALWSGATPGRASGPEPTATLPTLPDAAAQASISLATDETLRFTVPVMVNGRGPFRFIIDTGADRSAVSSRVVAALGLPFGETVKVHSMSGTNLIPSVKIATLQIAPDVEVHDIIAPVFAESDLGAEGLLGVDSLQGHQVVIDFIKHTMEIRTAKKHERPLLDDQGAVIVMARSKYGQLILVDSSLGPRSLRVVLDTGAQFAVGNLAMRRLAASLVREAPAQRVQMLSVVGKYVSADYTLIARIKLGGFVLMNTPVAFADAHPFARFGLAKEPAMLLGMDMLHLFRRVTIDFANRRVSFVPPPGLARE